MISRLCTFQGFGHNFNMLHIWGLWWGLSILCTFLSLICASSQDLHIWGLLSSLYAYRGSHYSKVFLQMFRAVVIICSRLPFHILRATVTIPRNVCTFKGCSFDDEVFQFCFCMFGGLWWCEEFAQQGHARDFKTLHINWLYCCSSQLCTLKGMQ